MNFTEQLQINGDNLLKSIHDLMSDENTDYYSEETYRYTERICDKLDKQIYLDESFNTNIQNDISMITSNAALDGFNKGFLMGISLLKSLLTAEQPILNVTTHEVKKRPESNVGGLIPIQRKDKELIQYIANAVPLLNDIDKARLQSKIQYLISK